jgi:tRNA A37 methylthiotransferase MiaB
VLVAELWLRPRWISLDSNDNNTVTPESGIDIKIDSNAVVGAFRGQNRVLSRANQRFRGQGVRPEAPEALRTYRIQTAGCQMNVADSERLEGVLAHDLNLRPHDGPNENVLEPADSEGSVRDGSEGRAESLAWPDVVVLNTCSIRDKAEQKVYNALGPYCAAKRQGRRMVVVVTGCVAQQEGQDLLARAPEVDAVVGPQVGRETRRM